MHCVQCTVLWYSNTLRLRRLRLACCGRVTIRARAPSRTGLIREQARICPTCGRPGAGNRPQTCGGDGGYHRLHAEQVPITNRRCRRRSGGADGGGGARPGRRARHGVRGDGVAGAQIPAGGARRAEPDAQRGPAAVARPLRRCRGSAPAGDRGVSTGGPAGVVRGAGADDVCRIERAGVSQGDEDLAAAARLAQAPRCGGRRLQAAPSLDRLGRSGRARYSRRRTATGDSSGGR